MPGRNIKQIRPGLVGPTTHKRVLASSTVFTMVHNQRDPTKSTPHHVVSLRTPSQTHASRTNSVAITGFAFKLFTSPVPYSLSPDSAQHLSELQLRGRLSFAPQQAHPTLPIKMAAGAETPFQMAGDSQRPPRHKIEGHTTSPLSHYCNRGTGNDPIPEQRTQWSRVPVCTLMHI